MKKLILAILIIVSATDVWAAILPQIATEQLVPGPWFSYVKSDSLKISEKDRTQNVKYSFNVKGPTDKDAIISCKIAFPKDIDVKFLSQSGIMIIGTSKSRNIVASTSYVDGKNTCFEFLISQKDKLNGYVELSLTIPYYYKNRNIPVAISYELMNKTQTIKDGITNNMVNNVLSGGTAFLGLACLPAVIIAPIPALLISGSLIAAGLNNPSPDAHNTVQNIFSELKRSYKRSSLYSSTARFTLHIE